MWFSFFCNDYDSFNIEHIFIFQLKLTKRQGNDIILTARCHILSKIGQLYLIHSCELSVPSLALTSKYLFSTFSTVHKLFTRMIIEQKLNIESRCK